MSQKTKTPTFRQALPKLYDFVVSLAKKYDKGTITQWDDFRAECTKFYVDEQMAEIEAVIPGWWKMASYHERVTLDHVTTVLAVTSLLPEYKSASRTLKNKMLWTVVFHDVAKIVPENRQRDFTHPFRSAVIAARALPKLGFSVLKTYDERIDAWSELVESAVIPAEDDSPAKPDNDKLPEIFEGMNDLFPKGSQTLHIVQAVMLHGSIPLLREWNPPSPFTNEEMVQFVNHDLYPTLKAMLLADNWAWSVTRPEKVDSEMWEARVNCARLAWVVGLI